jgi:hypothetical protein
MAQNHKGYIYILTNPSMQNMVKIGFTNRNVSLRAKELSAATGVPTPFQVHSAFRVPKGLSSKIESQIHKELSKYRVNKSREFFRLSPDQAKKKVQNHFKHYKRFKIWKFLVFLMIVAGLSYFWLFRIMPGLF